MSGLNLSISQFLPMKKSKRLMSTAKSDLIPARALIEFVLRWPHVNYLKPFFDMVLVAVGAIWAWGVCYGQVPHPGSPLPFLALRCAGTGADLLLLSTSSHLVASCFAL